MSADDMFNAEGKQLSEERMHHIPSFSDYQLGQLQFHQLS